MIKRLNSFKTVVFLIQHNFRSSMSKINSVLRSFSFYSVNIYHSLIYNNKQNKYRIFCIFIFLHIFLKYFISCKHIFNKLRDEHFILFLGKIISKIFSVNFFSNKFIFLIKCLYINRFQTIFIEILSI